jgi:hypothetical protein
MHIRLPVFVLVAIALWTAGCGSSKTGSSSATSTAAQSTNASTSAATSTSVADSGVRSQLIARADAICKQLNTTLRASKTIVSTRQQIVSVSARRVAIEQAALARLRKLTPPASMAQDYQGLLNARQTVVEDIKKLGEAAAAHNNTAQRPIYASSAIVTRQMAVTAKRDGFKYCGELG